MRRCSELAEVYFLLLHKKDSSLVGCIVIRAGEERDGGGKGTGTRSREMHVESGIFAFVSSDECNEGVGTEELLDTLSAGERKG